LKDPDYQYDESHIWTKDKDIYEKYFGYFNNYCKGNVTCELPLSITPEPSASKPPPKKVKEVIQVEETFDINDYWRRLTEKQSSSDSDSS
jgi:hypothetical protein